VGLKLKGAHQLPTYTVDVNLLGDNTDTIQKITEILTDASKELGPNVNVEKTKDMKNGVFWDVTSSGSCKNHRGLILLGAEYRNLKHVVTIRLLVIILHLLSQTYTSETQRFIHPKVFDSFGRQAVSAGQNYVGSTWKRGLTPVSERCVLNKRQTDGHYQVLR
jgi:hypothetical protein